MTEQELGKVIHWYDQIKVAVVKLSGILRVGDSIKIRQGNNKEEEFEAKVDSMQVNHAEVGSGQKDDEVAIKLPQKAKEGARIFLLAE